MTSLPPLARSIAALVVLGTGIAGCDRQAPETGQPGPAALSVTDAWARATPPGVTVGAAYFTIDNGGKQADTLLSAASPVASRIELHESLLENGVARMQPAEPRIIAPGERVAAAPGGLHAMLVDLQQPLRAGESVPLTLSFRRAGELTVQLQVRPLDWVAGDDGHAAH